MTRVCISTGCLPRLEGCQFHEFGSVVRMMKRFLRESRVDGFEFVLLPEWDSESAPLTPTSASASCEKHSVGEILETVASEGFPIRSVHANRDIGNYLCHADQGKRKKGIRLADECLGFARKVGAKVCVFHFWDTWIENLDLAWLKALYDELQRRFEEVELSVENIPTKHDEMTPFQVLQNFKYKTLDLKWASMYREFSSFQEDVGTLDNVHVQGRLRDGQLVATVGSLDFDQAIAKLKRNGYSGLFTIELENKPSFDEVSEYIESLRITLKV
jgi:sugar phosphate isomerase/epimerase